ncbi:Cryptochrome-like protein cry2 [Tepidimonas thermarum]|uniref:Cryptochrome-like protein cry2 n=1 Tax=Tepidimonas thermarum TaxID=335431 RepID=A0A554X277_9BURK|nr:cryptochrome/deoxyribodipyrimidine photo-lyase family protein [Tepidimonas thermarum]TSE29951.1 Cryptochrome-like protein cry2 [Tepidimonas thermarum]
MPVHVVWFKRDLRVQDHAPLVAAAAAGPVLAVYIVEPSLWRQPDSAAQHWGFIRESLAELDAALRATGRPHAGLHVLVGEALPAFDALHRHWGIAALYAHQETGNAHTFARDRAVRRWARQHGIPVHETPAFGVVRGLRQRDAWLTARERLMSAPLVSWPLRTLVFAPGPHHAPTAQEPPSRAPVAWYVRDGACLAPGPWPDAAMLGLDPWEPPQHQRGGRTLAQATLTGFLHERAAHYRGGISSPLTAPDACSRLSPYLAYGVLSLREVVQATRARRAAAAATPADDGGTLARRLATGLRAFESRLYWHCHFMQKLESEPELEWRNLHRGYDGLRERAWQPAHFDALRHGRTGWPLVDACVAMLRETGWLNFRMRAMLVSVAAYPLWLHWREVGLWLARQFLDYEPGIHWPQMQMQSGTTGINATRVYNPIKQAYDHDPHGVFVRRWLPALRQVPDAWLFEPWRMPPALQRCCGVTVGVDIPAPVVDLDQALRAAKARVHARRAEPAVRAQADEVVRRHGSRRGMPAGRDALGREPAARRRSAPPPNQLSLW